MTSRVARCFPLMAEALELFVVLSMALPSGISSGGSLRCVDSSSCTVHFNTSVTIDYLNCFVSVKASAQNPLFKNSSNNNRRMDVIWDMALAQRDEVVCAASNDYNGHNSLRILAVFIILISSALGVFFPIMASRYSFIRLPEWCFFVAKFFGSGVIVSTAFIHLLDPAAEALGNECLGGTFTEYPWAFGICLMSLFALFLTEIVSHYFITRSLGDDHGHHAPVKTATAQYVEVELNEYDESIEDSTFTNDSETHDSILKKQVQENNDNNDNNNDSGDKTIKDIPHISAVETFENDNNNGAQDLESNTANINSTPKLKTYTTVTLQSSTPGKDHFSHESNHQDPSQLGTPVEQEDMEQYLNQIVAVTILEMGIIFHSVFVGLSLSVSGEEFETLFIVLTFHQMFEGLGLGTRVAETNWPRSKRNTPWLMGLAFALTSPIAVAIGIGVRHSWVPGSRRALIANGVFDSISSGILIYTGLVELMAHEFLFSNQFKGPDGLKKMLFAYFVMCLGAGLMALLGKWA